MEPLSAGGRSMRNLATLTAALALASTSAAQTWAAQTSPTPGAELADGQPDVQGFWRAQRAGTISLTNPDFAGTAQAVRDRELRRQGKPIPKAPSRIVDPPDGEVPYQPWARARQVATQSNIDYPTRQEHIDPLARCFQVGVVRTLMSTEFELQQFPGYVVLVFGANHIYRVIPVDGGPHPAEAVKLWMSDSRGHWEGRTLVVDVANSNGKSRLDIIGDFFTEHAHVTERFDFSDPDAIDYRATIEDATVYTQPWTLRAKLVRAHADEPGYEQWEESCHEGEKNSDDSLLSPALARKARIAALHEN